MAARPGESQDALAAAVAAAAADTDRLIRLAEDLLLLARADDGTAFIAPERIDVSELVSSSARSFTAQADAAASKSLCKPGTSSLPSLIRTGCGKRWAASSTMRSGIPLMAASSR